MADTLGNVKSKADMVWYGVGYSAFSVMTISDSSYLISFIDISGEIISL